MSSNGLALMFALFALLDGMMLTVALIRNDVGKGVIWSLSFTGGAFATMSGAFLK